LGNLRSGFLVSPAEFGTLVALLLETSRRVVDVRIRKRGEPMEDFS
jgi:hypothetical protein